MNQNTPDISELESQRSAEEPEGTIEAQEIERRLAAKEEEVKTLNDRYLRLAAEFDNYKRLSQRDQREQAKFANERLLKELLPILDNLQRAVHYAKVDPGTEKSDGLRQGVELTLKQFIEALGQFGVKPITSVGEPFDPSRHQAVARTESSQHPAQTVVQEHQPGYLLHERILRPAMVTVAVAPTEGSEPSPVREEGEYHG